MRRVGPAARRACYAAGMPSTLVVGASRGIGLSLARTLVRRGHTVLGTTRQPTPALAAAGAEPIEGIDVTEPGCVARLRAALGERRLDGLLVNAGILERDGLGTLDAELSSVRRQLEVNALGPLRVVAGLVDRVADGGRIAIMTSRMGSLADNTSGGAYGYRMSKAAVNAAGVSLARDLAPRGIAVGLLHPGHVRTEMTRGTGNLGPDEAAEQLADRFERLEVVPGGQFLHANGDRLPW